jgi:hypothetical protein
MNVNTGLLFNLDIPLDYLNKLHKYYYIPQDRIVDLKLGGFVYVVDRLIPIKTIRYCGILTSIKGGEEVMTFFQNDRVNFSNSFQNDRVDFSNSFQNDRVNFSKFHVFYKPKGSRIQTAISLLSAIQ